MARAWLVFAALAVATTSAASFDDVLASTPAWQSLQAATDAFEKDLSAVESAFSAELDRACHVDDAPLGLLDRVRHRASPLSLRTHPPAPPRRHRGAL